MCYANSSILIFVCMFLFVSLGLFAVRFSRVHPAIAATAAAAAAALVAAGGQVQNPSRTRTPAPAADEAEQADAADVDNPWKLVAVRTRVQFTCGLKDVGMSGRADFKAIKTVIRCSLCLSLPIFCFAIYVVLCYIDRCTH